MTVSMLLDENAEHEMYHWLQKYGHDVEHIDFHETLHKGEKDWTVASYSLENEARIITCDDDFKTNHDESDYWGVLFFRITSGQRTT